MILPILLLTPFAAGVFSALARTRRAMEIANLAAFSLAVVLALGIAPTTSCLRGRRDARQRRPQFVRGFRGEAPLALLRFA